LNQTGRAEFKVASLSDFNKEAVETFVRQLRTDDKIGHRTSNHYFQALDSFLNWSVETKRLKSNPIAGAGRLNCDVDVRRKRRALSANEFAKLIAAAQASLKHRQGYSGEMRSRVYLLSYFTGLRKSEIASLTPASFDLKSATPTVVIEPTISKHRKEDVIPLHPELVKLVRKWISGVPATQKLFPNLERKKTSFMI
jgi:integrase